MRVFLNLDGVLHPNAVDFSRTTSPVLKAPGHRLFENSGLLEQVLFDFPDFSLTLNTWWTYMVSFDECLELLPRALSDRVDGSILPQGTLCTTLPDRISLATAAAMASNVPVVIIDHADARYPKSLLHLAFLVDPMQGLSDQYAVAALRQFLCRSRQGNNSHKRHA